MEPCLMAISLEETHFIGCVPEDFYLSWGGCMKGVKKDWKTRAEWMKPGEGFYKLNVNCAARDKPNLAGIGGSS